MDESYLQKLERRYSKRRHDDGKRLYTADVQLIHDFIAEVRRLRAQVAAAREALGGFSRYSVHGGTVWCERCGQNWDTHARSCLIGQALTALTADGPAKPAQEIVSDPQLELRAQCGKLRKALQGLMLTIDTAPRHVNGVPFWIGIFADWQITDATDALAADGPASEGEDEAMIHDTPGAPLATRVRDLRQLRKWSLSDLAKKSGLSRSYLHQIEKDESSPTYESILKLCSAFRVRPMFLTDGLVDIAGGVIKSETIYADADTVTLPAAEVRRLVLDVTKIARTKIDDRDAYHPLCRECGVLDGHTDDCWVGKIADVMWRCPQAVAAAGE